MPTVALPRGPMFPLPPTLDHGLALAQLACW